MRATLLPLDGKYYGTEIETDADGKRGLLKVWGIGAEQNPSVRQLAYWGFTPEAWAALPPQEQGDYWCDNHYESQGDLDAATAIVLALNGVR